MGKIVEIKNGKVIAKAEQVSITAKQVVLPDGTTAQRDMKEVALVDAGELSVVKGKPLSPKVFDTYSVDVAEYDILLGVGSAKTPAKEDLVLNGKTHKECFLWNGASWLPMCDGKAQKITIYEQLTGVPAQQQ